MKTPRHRVVCLGNLTDWGKRALKSLEKQSVVEFHYETSLKSFLKSSLATQLQMVFLENGPKSRLLMTELRKTGLPLYLIWFGVSFSKEDLGFAIQKHVFSVLEDRDLNNPRIIKEIRRIVRVIDSKYQFQQLVRSLKLAVLELEGNLPQPLLNEIKSGVESLSDFGTKNEFTPVLSHALTQGNQNILIQEAENLSEALTTIESLEKTGVMWVSPTGKGPKGQIEFIQGKIVFACCGEVVGLKAIFRMFLWEMPALLFSRRKAEEIEVGANIGTPIKMICQEGLRLKEQYDRIRHELPPLEMLLEIDSNFLHPGSSLSPEQFSTLAAVVEHRKVAHVLDYNPLPDVTIYEGLIQLRRSKILRIPS